VDVVQQKAEEEYSSMLPQATGFSQKLEQLLLLGRRESISDRRGLRTNASKDGMPAEGTYSIEAVRALDTH
nr:hypothetical protein [Tanacetum cinerariifolium]